MDSTLQPSRASPMGPLYRTTSNNHKSVRCPTCGCEWGIRDMLIPTNADPYNIIGSRMTMPTMITCGLCGRTLE